MDRGQVKNRNKTENLAASDSTGIMEIDPAMERVIASCLGKGPAQGLRGLQVSRPQRPVESCQPDPTIWVIPSLKLDRQSDQVRVTVIGVRHNLSDIVDGSRLFQPDARSWGGKAVQIYHASGTPQEGVLLAACGSGPSDSPATIIDTIGLTLGSSQGAEIRHHTRAVQEGVLWSVAGR